jgi:hypothetical protein
MIQEGSYVSLHGLKNNQYNGRQGMVVRRVQGRVEVQLAQETSTDASSNIRVHPRNLTLMLTYHTSRGKLHMKQVVEVTHYFEPVVSWPEELTGTYYDYLEVPWTATTDEIKQAFRRLSVKLHPDKNPAHVVKATKLFKQVKEAHDCLKDEYTRMLYNEQIGIGQRRCNHHWPPGPSTARRPKWPWN